MNPYDYEKECKRVVSLLRTEEGREAFKEGLLRTREGRQIVKSEFGISIVDQAERDAKPVVAILIPTHKKPENETGSALEKMIPVAREACHVILRPSVASSVVHWVRNQLLSTLRKDKVPFDYVLFMDDDMVPPPDAINVLLARKVDVIGAVCTVRQDPPLPNVRHFHEASGIFQTADIDRAGIWKVGAIGTGFLLIAKKVLDDVAEYTLSQRYAVKYLGMDPELANVREEKERARYAADHNAFWFEFLKQPKGDGEYGEDISFCFKARECGYDIYADSSIQVGHIGNYAYTLSDYWAYREDAVRSGKVVTIAPPGGETKPAPAQPTTDRISILVPTRGRPENVKRLCESIRETCEQRPEIIFYVDEDDPSIEAIHQIVHDYGWAETFVTGARVVTGPRRTLSECWNECAKVATGDLLMVGADDIVFRTQGWDSQVRKAFSESRDKLLMVFGDDGVWHEKFGTHPIIHRRWYEAIGYVTPPYFSADYCDTWLNDIAVALGRRKYIPFLNEHMHPLWGKAEEDQTYKDKTARGQNDNVEQRYKELRPERQADLDKLYNLMQQAEAVGVG